MNFQFNNFQKILFTLIIFYGIFGLAGSSLAAEPVTYYVDDNDCSDDYAGTSLDQPLCTFAEAMTKLQAGDTLIIKDGTYYQSLTVTVSGTQANPITIKAVNDGQAIINGQNAIQPLYIDGRHYINIEGIVFQNSNTHVVEINHSDHVNIRRVSAYNANYSTNSITYSIYTSSYILLEDCAAAGTGRVLYNIMESDLVTVRRCWGRWTSHSGSGGPKAFMQIYGSNDMIVENCVGTAASAVDVNGISIWAAVYNDSANNNKLYGNVLYDLSAWGLWTGSNKYNIHSNRYYHNALINNYGGFSIRADSDLQAENLTVVNSSDYDGLSIDSIPGQSYNSDFDINVLIKNSSITNNASRGINVDSLSLGTPTLTSRCSNTSGNGAANLYGEGSTIVNPLTINSDYSTSTYGKGAYLLVPPNLQGKGENGADIGATVLYRYKDGVPTNEPLWPWPMEDRIKNELNGISVTYESGGGIWKTLCGVYGEGDGCNDDITPPASPSGLVVN